ncbi:histamine H2 receptor-like [Paramacrobiotus metropolitanus]|uniref:histamine H2 receptor-like n=1 Tax=Paramacrobiotus metropolitanus TaxID=2943436 RepID=UPI002445CC08|nr:histamine H2 receptor-like [Paramacrobiotus metropolitanus]
MHDICQFALITDARTGYHRAIRCDNLSSCAKLHFILFFERDYKHLLKRNGLRLPKTNLLNFSLPNRDAVIMIYKYADNNVLTTSSDLDYSNQEWELLNIASGNLTDSFNTSYNASPRGKIPEEFERYRPVVEFYGIMFTVLFFFILFGNLLVIASFIKFRTIRKKLPHHWLFHLALADLLLGLSLPFHVFTFLDEYDFKKYVHIPYMCLSRYGTAELCIGASLCFLVGLAVHILFSVKFPYKYNLWISPFRIHVIAISIWITNFGYFLLPFLGLHEYQPELTTDGKISAYCDLVKVWTPWYTRLMIWMMVGLVLVLCTAYTIIFRVAWKKTRRDSLPTAFFNQPRNAKPVITFLLVTVSTMVCFAPFAVCSLLQLQHWKKRNDKDYNYQGDNNDLEVAAAIATFFLFLHSVLNPIIYSFRLPDFQIAFKALLCCHCGKSAQLLFD